MDYVLSHYTLTNEDRVIEGKVAMGLKEMT